MFYKSTSRWLPTLVAAASLLGVIGCGLESGVDQPPVTLWEADPSTERTLAPVAWDTLWTIESGLQDTVLQIPSRIQANDSQAVLLDIGSNRVIAFGTQDGSILWTFGSRGSGAEEFMGPRDVRLDRSGRIHVLDPAGNRITIISASGQLVGHVRLNEVGLANQLLPLNDGSYIILRGTVDDPLIHVDSHGKVQDEIAIPWAAIRDLSTLARQGWLVQHPTRPAWSFLFSIGNGFFLYDRKEPIDIVGRYVEHTSFPGVQTSTSGSTRVRTVSAKYCSACSVAATDGHIITLFGGEGDVDLQNIDAYSWKDGAYSASVRLPSKAVAIGYHVGTLYTIKRSPFPRITALALPEELR